MFLSVFKEPRGLVKCLQFGLAIFAFATTCGVFTQSSFTVRCFKTNKTTTHIIKIWYPFNLGMDDNRIAFPLCNSTKAGAHYPSGNYQSASEFYVFVGVMAFLYSLGAMVLYVFFNDNYENNDKIRIGDFVVTCVFVVMWLISSSAWADGLNGVKHFSNPLNDLFQRIDCGILAKNNIGECTPGPVGDFATLNVSLIFGFGNMVLFAASLWFLWKETPWHRSREESFPPQHSPDAGSGPQDAPQPADAQY